MIISEDLGYDLTATTLVLYTIHGWAKNIPKEIDFDNHLDLVISCDHHDSASAMNP
jgi:hypothetical protein